MQRMHMEIAVRMSPVICRGIHIPPFAPWRTVDQVRLRISLFIRLLFSATLQ